MNIKSIGIYAIMIGLSLTSVYGQGAKSLKINEVLISNETNFLDDYGLHSAWIEIFNPTYGSVNLRSCYLTIDKNNPTMYPIPKSDVQTLIEPRQHALFWADGMPNRGTFHVNFTLDPDKPNWIGLYDANGKTLIDSVTVPAGIPVDHSYARVEDGADEWVIKGGSDPSNYVTPSTNNRTIDKNTKIDAFKKYDSFGIGMSIIAMGVVFVGLSLLYFAFKLIGSIAVYLNKRNAMRAHGITDKQEAKAKSIGVEEGEVFAAIAMAMHEYQQDVHDVEATILTINKVKRNYSPWSSKIYTLRETPHRR